MMKKLILLLVLIAPSVMSGQPKLIIPDDLLLADLVKSGGSTPAVEWMKQISGSDNNDYTYGIKTDNAGNIIVGGFFYSSSITLGFLNGSPMIKTNMGGGDCFLAKYSRSGDLIWAVSFGSTGNDYIYDVAVDASNNIFIVGGYSGSMTLSGISPVTLSNKGLLDVFIAKYSSAGLLSWAKGFGSTNEDYAQSVAVNSDGQIAICGTFSGTVDFNPGTGTNNLISKGLKDGFVAKYSSSGAYSWAYRVGCALYDDFLKDVTVDTDNNVYAVGQVDRDTYFGSSSSSVAGNFVNGVILKLNSSGTLQWGNVLGGDLYDYFYSICAGKNGILYVGGAFGYEMDFDPSEGVTKLKDLSIGDESTNGFIAAYDFSGNFKWVKLVGSYGSCEVNDIKLDSKGNLFVSGDYNNNIFLNSDSLSYEVSTVDNFDGFVAKYNAYGSFINAAFLKGNGLDYPRKIDVAGDDTCVFIGTFEQDTRVVLNNDSISLTSSGYKDSYLSKLTFICVKPQITMDLQSQTVFAAQSFSLNLKVIGDGLMTFKWRKDGKIILVTNEPAYYVSEASDTVAGKYDCIVENACGIDTSGVAEVKFVKYADIGDGFVVKAKPLVKSVYDICFVNPNKGFALGQLDGYVYTTANAGVTWTKKLIGVTGSYLNPWWTKLKFVDSNNGFMISSDYNDFARTANQGLTWTAFKIKDKLSVSNSNFLDLDFVDSKIGYIVGNSGFIAKTTDAGDSWTVLNYSTLAKPFTIHYITAVEFVNATTGWIGTANGEIYKTSNGGTSWIKQTTGVEDENALYYSDIISDITFIDNLRGWAVGRFNGFLRTTDGGISWANYKVKNEYYTCSNTVSFVDSLKGWAADYHEVYHTVDGGKSWYKIFDNEGYNLTKLQFIDSLTGFICGNDGLIMQTISGGCIGPRVELYKDTLVCGFSNYTLVADSFNKGDYYFYNWNSGVSDSGKFKVTQPGKNLVEVKALCGQSAKDSVSIAFYPRTVVNAGPDFSICKGAKRTLHTSGGVKCNWSPSSNLSDSTSFTPVFAAASLGVNEYITVFTDKNNCNEQDTIRITVNEPEKLSVCMVTVDVATGNNMVVWEPKKNNSLASYNIYRQTNTLDKYVKIGNVAYGKPGIFVDLASQHEKQEEFYRVTQVDTCGNEFPVDSSKYHKAIFLQYVSSENGVNLKWETYKVEDGTIDFVSYVIYKGSDSTKLKVVDTIAANSSVYTDKDPEALLYKKFYRVAGVKASGCNSDLSSRKAGGGVYVQAVSNMEDNRLRATYSQNRDMPSDLVMSLYPQPVKNNLNISYSLSTGSEIDIEVYTVLGISILSKKLGWRSSGIYSDLIDLSKANVSKGLYYLKLQSNKGSVTKKFIVQ